MRLAAKKFRPVRGLTLVELTVGLFVVLTALGVGVTALTRAAQARKIESQRFAAREVVDLQLERLRAAPAALPALGQSREIPMPPFYSKQLRGATCSTEVLAVEGEKELIRVRVVVKPKGPAAAVSGEAILRKLPAAGL